MYNTINTEKIHADLEAKRLECATDKDYVILNAEIETINKKLVENAVEMVATGADIMAVLLNEPVINQFAPVADNGENVQLKKTPKAINYSMVATYIKKHNKAVDKGEKSGKISLPFNSIDYVLFNIYGANISRETLSNLEINTLKRLETYITDVECFNSSSNSKMKDQLNMLYARIGEIAKNGIEVKAIEKCTKFIAMEFVKYKSANHTIRINNADKLIDFVINQYIISRDKKAITVKSGLDIHKMPKDGNK